MTVAVLHCRTVWLSKWLTCLLVKNMLMCISGMAFAMEMVGLLYWYTGSDKNFTEYHIAKHERMWLQVQVILIHWFSLIKSSVEMLWIVLQCLLFLLNEQILFTFASFKESVVWNVSVDILLILEELKCQETVFCFCFDSFYSIYFLHSFPQ